jgi:hypothetical protein
LGTLGFEAGIVLLKLLGFECCLLELLFEYVEQLLLLGFDQLAKLHFNIINYFNYLFDHLRKAKRYFNLPIAYSNKAMS